MYIFNSSLTSKNNPHTHGPKMMSISISKWQCFALHDYKNKSQIPRANSYKASKGSNTDAPRSFVPITAKSNSKLESHLVNRDTSNTNNIIFDIKRTRNTYKESKKITTTYSKNKAKVFNFAMIPSVKLCQ